MGPSIKSTFLKPTLCTWGLVALAILFSNCEESDSPKANTIKLVELLTLNDLDTDDFIVDFQFDTNGILWVASFYGDLYRIANNDTVIFNELNSPLQSDKINDIFIDYKNRVWIATNNGFAKYENGNWEINDMENTPLAISRVSQIAVNRKDEILIGNGSAIEGGLLFLTSDGLWKNYNTNNSKLPCTLTYEIELTEDDNFWISTAQYQGFGGVVKFENETITDVFNKYSGLLYNHIDNIEITSQHIWIGFWVGIFDKSAFPDGGIQRVDLESNNITNFFPNETSLVSNRITAMKLSSDNLLWFATSIDDPGCINCLSGIGVILKNEDIIAISALNSDVISNDYFTELNEDFEGNMYVATEKSIYRLELN